MMYLWLQKLTSKNKVALGNVGYLACLQILTLIFPLISYPYLVRTLGSHIYGEIILAQGMALFLCAFISYGFNLSATRDISLNKNKTRTISKIYTVIITSKLIIFTPSVIVFFIYGYYVPSEDMRLIYILCVGPLIFEVFFPTWFYQGMEKMKYITILNAICRFLLLISIFIFVKTSKDGLVLATLNLIFYVSLSVLSQIMVYLKFNVKLCNVSYRYIAYSFKRGYSIFISTIFIAIKDRLNIIIVGIVFGPSQVIIYDLAMKVVSVLSIPQNIILTAFFPKVVKDKKYKEIKIISLTILLINIFIVLLAYAFLPMLLDYTLKSYHENDLLIIYILVFSVVLVGISSSQARLILLPFSFDKLLAKTVVLNCLIYFLAIAFYLLIPIEKDLLTFSLVIICIYFTEVFIRASAVKKIKRDNSQLFNY